MAVPAASRRSLCEARLSTGVQRCAVPIGGTVDALVASRARSRRESSIDEESRASLVEEMGLVWAELGEPRMQGRVLGYLMLSNAPYVSSAELAEGLHASTGSISGATKVLVDEGFIRRVAVAGERSYFFRAEDDVWGAFLATEGRYLRRRQLFAERALAGARAGRRAPTHPFPKHEGLPRVAGGPP